MKTVKIILVTLIIFIISYLSIDACFVVRVNFNGKILIGNNEDFNDPRTKMWFMPRTDKEHGRVCFGFNKPYSVVQGGMNEKGLFLDALGMSQVEWKPNSDKPDFEGQINDYILAKFSTIDEVKNFFNTYNVFLGGGIFVVADPSGRSMAIEYDSAAGMNRFIESKKNFQLVSNYRQYGIREDDKSDYRYKIARKIIQKEKKVSFRTVKKVLSAVHSDWPSSTLYSYICDLKAKKVFVYNFHNYEEEYLVDLEKELKKGKHYYDLPSLFLVKTYAASRFDRISPKRGADEIIKIIDKEGVDSAVNWYNKVKDKTFRTMRKYIFRESKFNSIGYNYLKEKKYDNAIAVFTFNTRAYPNSANAWDSLAEVYKKKGENKKAVKFYKKSLMLNPDNKNAKKNIKILEKN